MKPFRLPRWRFINCCGHVWGHRSEPEDADRRQFFKVAAVTVAGLAGLGTAKTPATAQVRVFPPPPPAVSPIEGLIDFHTHSAPDVFGRAVDDDEAATLYRERRLEAIVLKSHTALTADRAWLLQKHVSGIKAFGGVALNGPAGGINPEAVQWMSIP